MGRHAPLRQTYALPSPNAGLTHSAAPGLALPALGPVPWSSRPPGIQEQSACSLHDLGPLMALPSRRGAPHVRLEQQKSIFVWRRRLRPARRGRTAALSLGARCTFVLRMVLSPQRGAHFPYLRGHEHHLGSAKFSSRLRAVRILKNELSLARGAHFYAHL